MISITTNAMYEQEGLNENQIRPSRAGGKSIRYGKYIANRCKNAKHQDENHQKFEARNPYNGLARTVGHNYPTLNLDAQLFQCPTTL